MGKKRCRSKRTSKGIGINVNKKIINSLSREVSLVDSLLHKIDAWKAGKNPWITIENPSPNATNKKFIKVKANEIYGNPKFASYSIYRGKEAE